MNENDDEKKLINKLVETIFFFLFLFIYALYFFTHLPFFLLFH